MSTELGRLTAVFDANTQGFDAGLRHMDRGIDNATTRTQRFSQALNNALNTVSPRLGGEINQISNSLNTATSSASVFGGAIGVAGIAVTGFVAIVGTATKAIYGLATNAAATTDRVGDMAEKINFSVRTLSGLEPATEAAGSSLEGLSTALGIFDRNIEAAAQGQVRLSKLFKGLKVDTTNNEMAFRQVAEILVKLDGTAQQTALAMELFGRSGKDVLGIIKAADGDVEKFIRSMEALGIVINDDAVKAADAFDKKLILVKAQINTVIRQLGEEFIPMVSEAAGNLSNWLKENQGEIRKTITEIANLVKAITGLAQYVKFLSPIILVVETVNMFRNLLPTSASGQSITNQQQRNVFTVDPVTGRRIYSGSAPYDTAGEYAIAGGAGQYSTGAGSPAPPQSNALADQVRKLLSRGGGGRGGGGAKSDPLADMKRLADIQLKYTLETLTAEEEAIERSYDKRRTVIATYERAISRLEENRHKTILDALKSEQDAITNSKTLTATQKKIALQEIDLKRVEEANRHRREENKLTDNILRATRERIVLVETQIRQAERLRYANDQIIRDFGGGSVEMGEAARLATTRSRRVADAIRPRIATDAERAARERYHDALAQIDQMGYRLKNVFERAVFDGFERGGMRGLQSLTLGIIDIFQNVLMRQIEGLLSGAIGKAATGGGWLSKLIGFVLPGIGGALGGPLTGGITGGSIGSTLAGAIGRDTGGPIWPDKLYKVHKDEYIMPTGPGYVIPKGGIGGQNVVHNHYTINLPPDSRASYTSPRSKRQLSDTLIAALAAAQT